MIKSQVYCFLDTVYMLLNLSFINAKLTSLFYVHASKYICFSASVHLCHNNNGYNNVRFGTFSH